MVIKTSIDAFLAQKHLRFLKARFWCLVYPVEAMVNFKDQSSFAKGRLQVAAEYKKFSCPMIVATWNYLS